MLQGSAAYEVGEAGAEAVKGLTITQQGSEPLGGLLPRRLEVYGEGGGRIAVVAHRALVDHVDADHVVGDV